MAQDDDLRDDSYTDFNDDDRMETTNREDMTDETLRDQGVNPQRDIDRRERDNLSDEMEDPDSM